MSLRNAVNQEQIDAIVQSWLSAKLDEDRAHRMNSDEIKDYAERHNMTPERALAYLLGLDAEGELDRWRRVIRDNNWREAAPYVNSLIKQLGLSLSKDSPAYGLLCQGITLASGELQGIPGRARTDGKYAILQL
jgi:hypothetical protein